MDSNWHYEKSSSSPRPGAVLRISCQSKNELKHFQSGKNGLAKIKGLRLFLRNPFIFMEPMSRIELLTC
jgi:hypothetical protein